MKFKMRLLDYFILLIFLAVIGFAAMKVFTKKSGSRILMVQTQGERYAYSMGKNMRLEFSGPCGKSIIIIENEEAWFEHSDCENRVCVESGKISRPNQWAACLPNGIIIYIEGEEEKESLDAISN